MSISHLTFSVIRVIIKAVHKLVFSYFILYYVISLFILYYIINLCLIIVFSCINQLIFNMVIHNKFQFCINSFAKIVVQSHLKKHNVGKHVRQNQNIMQIVKTDYTVFSFPSIRYLLCTYLFNRLTINQHTLLNDC